MNNLHQKSKLIKIIFRIVLKLTIFSFFLVGSGGLGSEYLKLFSLLGIGKNAGSVLVTDDSRVEISNLTRLFLFN